MGACASAEEKVLTKEERMRQKEIETQLRKDKRRLDREVKLLLLGAGESGKSTVLRQMKIIHQNGFSDEEKRSFRDVIHSNVLGSMRALITAAEKFNMPLLEENKQRAATLMSNTLLAEQELTPQLAADVKALWSDPAIKGAFARACEFQLGDSAKYFFDNIDRLAGPSYQPTEQDILRSRAKTTGITETEFDVDGSHFRMVDVGGQRSERKKWIHCFQEVTAVIFFVALSEYDLKLYEDETVNRMHESIKLFDEICNSKWFANTSVILFLNKFDIFQEKIKRINLNVCFPDYDGGLDDQKGSLFIKEKFVKLNRTQQKHVYPHITCATDTQNIRFVFSAVKDTILHQALDASGF